MIVVVDEARRHRLAIEVDDLRICCSKATDVLGATNGRDRVAGYRDSLRNGKIFINGQYLAVDEDVVGTGLRLGWDRFAIGVRSSPGSGRRSRLPAKYWQTASSP